MDNRNGSLLYLFVAGDTPNSRRAVVNARRYCEEYLTGRYELHVIDVSENPEVAKEEQLVALPTLVKKFPLPEHRLIGDLSDVTKLEQRLHIGHDR